MHLDVWVDDLTAAHEEAIARGARLLKPADDPEAAAGFQVYADPAGHPFCLCWGRRTPGLQRPISSYARPSSGLDKDSRH